VNLGKHIALDANILIRAALGERVGYLLETYCPHVDFFAPETCFAEARKYVPSILSKHACADKIPKALTMLETLEKEGVVQPLAVSSYGIFEMEAKRRIAARDPNDWQLVAVALLLDCPIWTEDKDFFGTGVSVWNTANVEIYLEDD
jgi:predicted nucleic acid-binding protein